MAEVFRAKSYGVEGFEKIIAIKRILPTMGEDREFIKMFIDEAKIAGQLAHTNICQIFELGRIDGSHFIAMEFIWGKDVLQLQNRLRKLKQPMPVPMACHVIAKACEGLDYAHKKRDQAGRPLEIVHRDVSPQNILVSYDGDVKVIDFGIAKASSRSVRTQAGVLKGKFGYMSPEQVRGLPLDRRSDIFALGTILYEMLTSTRLFQGETDFATLEKVRNVTMPKPRTVNPNIPEEVEAIIYKALTKDANDRYEWAADMNADLQRFLMSQPTVYAPKALSAALKELFAAEVEREKQQLDQYKKLGRDGLVAGVPSAQAKVDVVEALGPAGEAPEPTMLGGPSFEEEMQAGSTEVVPEGLLPELQQAAAAAQAAVAARAAQRSAASMSGIANRAPSTVKVADFTDDLPTGAFSDPVETTEDDDGELMSSDLIEDDASHIGSAPQRGNAYQPPSRLPSDLFAGTSGVGMPSLETAPEPAQASVANVLSGWGDAGVGSSGSHVAPATAGRTLFGPSTGVVPVQRQTGAFDAPAAPAVAAVVLPPVVAPSAAPKAGASPLWNIAPQQEPSTSGQAPNWPGYAAGTVNKNSGVRRDVAIGVGVALAALVAFIVVKFVVLKDDAPPPKPAIAPTLKVVAQACVPASKCLLTVDGAAYGPIVGALDVNVGRGSHRVIVKDAGGDVICDRSVMLQHTAVTVTCVPTLEEGSAAGGANSVGPNSGGPSGSRAAAGGADAAAAGGSLGSAVPVAATPQGGSASASVGPGAAAPSNSGEGSVPSTGSAGSAAPAAAEAPGYLLIYSDPRGARVIIDGVNTGRITPIVARERLELSPGRHKVTLETASLKMTYEVVIRANDTETLTKELR